jgi:hypothetical protein
MTEQLGERAMCSSESRNQDTGRRGLFLTRRSRMPVDPVWVLPLFGEAVPFLSDLE